MKVSVIIPVYNAAEYVARSVGSALGQSHPDLEVIAVNDASQDSSLEVLKNLRKADQRLRIVDKPQNQGTMLARKSGLLEARGDYVTFLDADDFLLGHDALATLCAKAAETGADVIIGDVMKMKAQGDPAPAYIRRATQADTAGEYVRRFLTSSDTRGACGILFRRSLYNEETFVEWPHQCAGEDKMWFLQYMAHAETVAKVHQAVYGYFDNTASICNQAPSPTIVEQMCRANTWCHDFIIGRWGYTREADFDLANVAQLIVYKIITSGGGMVLDISKRPLRNLQKRTPSDACAKALASNRHSTAWPGPTADCTGGCSALCTRP